MYESHWREKKVWKIKNLNSASALDHPPPFCLRKNFLIFGKNGRPLIFFVLCSSPDSSLTGYSYCPEVGAVLQRTHDNKLFNFTDGDYICKLYNGRLLSRKAHLSNCALTLLGGTRVAWIDQFVDGSNNATAYVTETARSNTRFVHKSGYVTCEIREGHTHVMTSVNLCFPHETLSLVVLLQAEVSPRATLLGKNIL